VERKPTNVDRAGGLELEIISGTVERVTFHNPESGFSVLRVHVRGHRDLVTIVGHAASISPGEHVQATGGWVNDRVHGRQFGARHLQTAAPPTLQGIEKYLGSGLIKGIGPHFAKKLVNAFGADVFDVIEREPHRLRTVEGIGPVRASSMAAAWEEQKAIREIMMFLHAHGVGTSRAVRIFRTYGSEAIALIRENPYRLATDIRGIGFLTADQIAGRMGIAKDALIRVCAGIGYVLSQATDEGHCGLPIDDLEARATKLLEVPASLFRHALEMELGAGTVIPERIDGRPSVLLAALHAAETGIAARIRRLASGEQPWPSIDVEKAIPWVERRVGISLAGAQADAVRMAVSRRFLVITGGPGVGKTTHE
jgi:exodeoxyribonuclease V alpha subunit